MLTTSSNSLTAANQFKPFHEGAKGVNLPVCIKISKTIFPSIWRTRSHCDRGAEPWDKACAIFSSSSQTRTEVGFLLPYLPIAFYIFTLFCCLNPLIWLTSLLVVCSAKLQTGRTHRSLLIILAAILLPFERSCFWRIAFIHFHAFVMPKPLVSLTGQLEAVGSEQETNNFGFFTRNARQSPVLLCPCVAKAAQGRGNFIGFSAAPM